MTATEKSLKIWNQANELPAPTVADNQFMRSLDCRPEFLGVNVWQTPSTTKTNVVYLQNVYFRGFSNDYTHGMDLYIECSCPATKECKHALKIQRVYCSNWAYLFILFGMEESKRFGELWSRAQAVAERMERDSFAQAA
jgi:hypothetical protein